MISTDGLARDEFFKGGEDGDFLIFGNELEDIGIDTIDSCELVGSRDSFYLAFDVDNFVAIHRDAEGWAVVLHREGCDVV